MSTRILRRSEVCQITGLGATYLDTLERRGEFPQRRQLTGRTYGWLSDDVERWIRTRPVINLADSRKGAAQESEAP